MTLSKIFFCFCLFFIGGIFLESIIHFPQVAVSAILILAVILTSVLWRYKQYVLTGVCLTFLVFGICWCQKAEIKAIDNELEKYNENEGETLFLGTISAEPDIRENNQKLVLSNLQTVEDSPQQVGGKVLATVNKYEDWEYGDRVKIKGELKTPDVFTDFNYQGYLAKDGIYSVVYYPEIELLEKDKGCPTSIIYGWILKVKDRMREVIGQRFSPPQSLILGAVILGDKRQIPEDWKLKLNYSGLRHLTAVSGMHVAILTAVLMNFFIGIGLWRKHAFWLTLILISLFVVFTGFQSSTLRAGIMGGFFLLAQYFGRESNSIRAITIAAALMLFFNPLLLRLDIGFQLSFLAMLGIIYFMPFFKKKNILTLTLSAQVFTLPILIYNFGYFSLVSPLSNILVVPFLPFIMILGFLFAIFSLIWWPLGWIFLFPLWVLLTYLIKIVEWFSALPFSVYFLEVHFAFLFLYYLVLGILVWKWQEKERLRFLKY